MKDGPLSFCQRHAYGFGCGFAALFWPFFTRRRRISIENILRCGITDDPKTAKRIAKKAFCHFAGHICEALCAPGVITKENYREHLDFADATPGVVKTLLDSPETPILLVSGHHGCWEVATHILSMARPMIAIARVMDSKILQSWMKKHHFRGPVTVISKNDGITKAVLGKWQAERSAMTILMDQYAHHGALLSFLGRPARTVTSAARLAIRYGYPVVVGSFVRIAPYRYRLVGEDPVVFGKDEDRDRATQVLNDRLSGAIRKYPEQYLWMHRRWRDD